ncbi:hypothetical protein ACH5RR_028327 [Cinchona calisaya]|uniref:F-box domain-containing protein n=1 Tax=Cinchona calisaya TaxID=153742 RepID=A0ABD2YNF0_9GENT
MEISHNMKSFPADILKEILRRLPVKSLIRFRCVCKSWCAFIKSPEFIALHLSSRRHSHADDDTNILIMRFIKDTKKYVLSFHSNKESMDTIAPDLEVPIFHDYGAAVLLGPSNGIVCIVSRQDICLCNPATHEFRRLPPWPFGCPQDFYRYFAASGFGYDPIRNDYKVIGLVTLSHVYDYHTYELRAEIYNLNTNSWRESDNTIPLQHFHNACISISFQGSLHWSFVDRILTFHLNSEEFTTIEYPDRDQDVEEYSDQGFPRPRVRSLAVLDKSLGLITCIYDDSDPEIISLDINKYRSIDVWLMKECGIQESWTRVFSIVSLADINLPSSFPLCFRKDEEELSIQTIDGQLISCVLRHCQKLRKFNVYEHYPGGVVVSYRESLVSVQE